MWHDGKVSYLYCGNQFIIHKYEINILSVVTQGHNSKNQGGSFNVGTKTRPLWPFPYLPHVVAINGFQVLLSCITCLPSYPRGRSYLP